MTAKSTPMYTPYQMIDSRGPSLRSYLSPYFRQWPWFVLSLTFALSGAKLYLLYKQPVYRIEATLLLQDEKKGNQQANPLKELDGYSPKKMVENELEVLTSSTLMGRVVDKLHLTTRYFSKTPFGRDYVEKLSFGKREMYTESPVRLLVESPSPALYDKMLELRFPTAQPCSSTTGRIPSTSRYKRPTVGYGCSPARQLDPPRSPFLFRSCPSRRQLACTEVA